MNKLDFIHHEEEPNDKSSVEWYAVMYENAQVLTIRRQPDSPYRWVAVDTDGRQCFEANQYRNDLFEEIEFEGDFK